MSTQRIPTVAVKIAWEEYLDKFKCQEAKCREKPWKSPARTYGTKSPSRSEALRFIDSAKSPSWHLNLSRYSSHVLLCRTQANSRSSHFKIAWACRGGAKSVHTCRRIFPFFFFSFFFFLLHLQTFYLLLFNNFYPFLSGFHENEVGPTSFK